MKCLEPYLAHNKYYVDVLQVKVIPQTNTCVLSLLIASPGLETPVVVTSSHSYLTLFKDQKGNSSLFPNRGKKIPVIH